jgi:hypothetical protein
VLSFSWQICVHPSRRQVISLLLLAMYAALLPVPVISFSPKDGKDQSRPFPCQNRPCGCRTAEQCKKKCCCFSDGQKLAWAKRNGVDPSEVVASTTKRGTASESAPKVCCTIKNGAKTQVAHRQPKATSASKSRYKIVIGAVADNCQGLAKTAYGQAVFLMPPMTSLNPLVESIVERFIIRGSVVVQRIVEPPVPPPRISAV